jgi:hypothetical protein
LLLNKRNAPSLDHAFSSITEAVKLDSGAVRKVFTLSGAQVSQFVTICHNILVSRFMGNVFPSMSLNIKIGNGIEFFFWDN